MTTSTIRLSTAKIVGSLLVIVVVAASCSNSRGLGDLADGGSDDRTESTVGSTEDQANPSSEPGISIDIDGNEIVLTSGLENFNGCDALLDRIKSEALERVGPYGFGQGGPIIFENFARSAVDVNQTTPNAALLADDASAPANTAPQADAMSRDGAGTFSGTNNQELDVDEADLVKTDGKRLVIAMNQTLNVIDTTGSEPRLIKSIKLPDEVYGGQMFLHGNRVLLMTSGWTETPFLPTDNGLARDIAWFPGSPVAKLIAINLDSGEIEQTLEFEGSYLSAREVNDSIRIVLNASAERFSFLYPSNEGAEDSAEAANRSLIEESTIEQWIPTFRRTQGSEVVDEGPIVDCNQVHIPREFAGFGSLLVLTADLNGGLSINDGVSVFTDAQTVYASTDRVVVATPRWPEWGPDGEIVSSSDDYTTALHTFDITDPTTARYVASGSVRGSLLNQFSMSEWQGNLRVATTESAPWDRRENSESFVTVLGENGGHLKELGRVGGIGKGEQIFSVRFLGAKGYVVTFRQVDPLYTLDLSDPANPSVTGELKIPGFSTYLHPVSDTHLIGIGTDGDDDGRTFGTVMSLFDVSDPTNPTRTDKVALGPEFSNGEEGDSHTDVDGDSKAFTYWDNIGIVPVSWYRYNQSEGQEQNGSEAVLIDVDANEGLREIGRVSHPSVTECEDGIYPEPALESADAEADLVKPIAPEHCYTWTPSIRRSVIIGDDLYTVSDAGVLVSNFNSLETRSWIKFEQFNR